MNSIGRITVALLCLFLAHTADAQLVQKGKITYERKTNLQKKFRDNEHMARMLTDANKIMIDVFALYFNDSLSAFTYVVPDQLPMMNWATTKNAVYQNYAKGQRTVFMDVWGDQRVITDSLARRRWKITDKTRKIAGYECTRAIWEKNDSTRIYAWFTTDIIPTVGPESVQGLPGAILGLATEDGGVVFFATKVELIEPAPEQLAQPKKKGKEYTEAALRAELMEKMEGQPYGDRVMNELFFW